MPIVLLFRAGLGAVLLGLWLAGTSAHAAGIVTFCQQHGTLDYPAKIYFGARYQPGMIPPQVEAVEASSWRCLDGRVLLCQNSADGDSCSKKDSSRVPNIDIRESCEENGSVSSAVAAYSASTWRCENKRPVIVRTWRLDKRGFMAEMWRPYRLRNGKPVTPDFANPR